MKSWRVVDVRLLFLVIALGGFFWGSLTLLQMMWPRYMALSWPDSIGAFVRLQFVTLPFLDAGFKLGLVVLTGGGLLVLALGDRLTRRLERHLRQRRQARLRVAAEMREQAWIDARRAADEALDARHLAVEARRAAHAAGRPERIAAARARKRARRAERRG